MVTANSSAKHGLFSGDSLYLSVQLFNVSFRNWSIKNPTIPCISMPSKPACSMTFCAAITYCTYSATLAFVNGCGGDGGDALLGCRYWLEGVPPSFHALRGDGECVTHPEMYSKDGSSILSSSGYAARLSAQSCKYMNNPFAGMLCLAHGCTGVS